MLLERALPDKRVEPEKSGPKINEQGVSHLDRSNEGLTPPNDKWQQASSPVEIIHGNGDLHFLAALISSHEPKSKSTILARRLIKAYGTVAKVLAAPVEDISILLGSDECGAQQIKASYQAVIRTISIRICEAPALDYDAIRDMTLWTIGNSPVEQVQLFYLDHGQRVTGNEVICSGSESFVSVSVKTVMRAVLRKNAASFIVAHNHPGGSVEPSNRDLSFTDDLLKAAAMIQVGFLESIIVSGDRCYSLRANGFL